jgi:SAM-dependent methyltransferase
VTSAPSACPACGESGATLRHEVGGYEVRACAGCGVWYVPGESGAYGGGYLEREEGALPRGRLGGYVDYEGERALHLRNFRRHVAIVARHAPGRRLLDVGCASGHFLAAAAAAGFDVEGVDVSEAGPAAARRAGFRAQAGDVRSLDLGRFDAITMWETLEHIADPRPAVAHLRGLLSPGGVLVVGTGDHQSLLARALGRRWWYLVPPDHCVIYHRPSLEGLLARSGFAIAAFERIAWQYVSSRNAAWKALRSFDVPAPRALPLSRRLPDVALPVWHGTTMVAVARSG